MSSSLYLILSFAAYTILCSLQLLTVAKDVAPARPSAPAVAKPTHPHIKLDDRQGFVSLLLADKGGSYPVIHPSYCTRISDFQPRT
jgi:hypothetical protein